MPQGAEVVKHPFGTFSFAVAAIIIAVIFCVMYFYVRRKKKAPRVDEKAGDEGED